MKIFLDTADINEIERAYETGMVKGITTNPTLIKRSGRDPVEVIKEISYRFIGFQSVSAEVVADTAEEMVNQALSFKSILENNITIKVPCTVEGLKACRILRTRGYEVNVTLVFSVAQAILAEKAGAKYVSPFVGRCMDNNIDGIELIRDISEVYGRNESNFTSVLGASLRNIRQVEQCAIAGADIVTIPPEVFWEMYNHELTDKGLEQFQKDWEDVVSK
jgi:transaldolase